MLKIVLLTIFSFAPADSIRTETVNGRLFVIHQVTAGETLYAIAKRYKASVEAIKKSNDNPEAGIKEGQMLRIPIEKKADKAAKKENNAQVDQKTHTVAAKETLSAIARQYKLSVKQLKELNSLETNEVKIGQILVVSGAKPAVKEKKETAKETPQEKKIAVKTEKPAVAEKKKEAQKEMKAVEKKEEVITISENIIDSDEVKESGLAEIMDGTEGSRKYLALHRKIKVGSIVKVRNSATNKEVFVRVTGSIPEGGDEKVIIRISRSAFDRLGGADTNFTAEVTYYK